MADVELSGVVKRFGTTTVLHDIDLAIADGEFVIFVGPSGSGKSTLLRVLAGLEMVSDGRVMLGGRDVTAEPPKARNVSMVFQNYALYPHMTVEKNITFGMRIRREAKVDQQAALTRVVGMLKLDGLLDRKPRQLSGGQRQRVAMARAIVHEPDLFLMDEPLSNLDAKLRNEVRLSIMELQKELRCTMVYVTHDQIEAMTMADRVVVLDQGRIQQIGTSQELYHRPGNRFTAGFIGTPAMNFLSLARNEGRVYLPNGSVLPLPAQLADKVLRNGSVVLGLRPEHVFADAGECRQANRGDELSETLISLPTKIKTREMLGSEFLLHTGDEADRLRFRHKNNHTLPAAGEQVKLHFSLASVHLFDEATGKRIN